MTQNEQSFEKTILPVSAMLNPVPVVMISCAGLHPENPEERPNIITIAWAGTINSEPPMVSVSIRPERHSHSLIRDTKEFVINLVSENLIKACDYCGVRSGAKEDKFLAMSLTAIPAEGLSYAPAIKEAPVSLSCKVVSVTRLGSHDLFMAQIVGITANTELMNKAGKLCMEDAGLTCYSHGEYFSLGRYLGFFGFSVASPEALKRRNEGRSAARSSVKPSVKPAGKPYDKRNHSEDGRPSRSSAASGRRSSAGLPGSSAYERKMGSSAQTGKGSVKDRIKKDTRRKPGNA
jgi:flavin reductase (DIM6/NTAB) family NADH-FMN oxidoreductase RutF